MHGDPLRQALILLALAAAAFAVFGLWPGLDLRVSGLFFDPVTGFSAYATGGWNLLRLAIWRLCEFVLAFSILACLASLAAPFPLLRATRRLWPFIATLFILGPGILADFTLKRLWGRARPADVTEFGGPLDFTPPHVIARQCTGNCSFVSGEVSGTVALSIALLLLLDRIRTQISPAAYRNAKVIILLLPLYVAFQRIAAGRHFLSDAIFAALLVLLCAVVLKSLILLPRRR
jgi:lipid A 4'-phosphatase